ncbi:hypothetical protein EDC01DRAFT_176259 [Geopyxis carbonaria]|nr:hypothetical protein EDC01DRAFT_176259 [Geopyxis carbonaria]
MSSVVTDLETALQTMQSAKPPGVSGSKIALITELSVNNVQSESVIIQKLYTHFKKCPGTHKLGPLYVVDSIARRYLEFAKKNHQEVSGSAPDGTFAAGVFRITNLLPPLMNDILQHAPPDENKDKIEKLFAIWERSSTFPPEVLADIKAKMHASPMFQAQNQLSSSTPPGSPPQHLRLQPSSTHGQQAPRQPSITQASAPQSNGVASMLQAIAQMAKQNQHTAAPTPPPPTMPIVPEPSHMMANPATQYSIPTSQSNGYPPVSNSASLPPSTLSQAAMSMPYTSTPPNANSNPALQALAGQLSGAYSMFQPNQPQQPAYPQFAAPQQQQQPQPQPQMDQLALLQLLLQQPGFSQIANPQIALQGLLAAQQQNGQLPNTGDNSQFWSQMGNNMGQAQDPRAGDPNQYGDDRRGRGYSPPPRSPPRFNGGSRRGRSRSQSPDRFDRDTRSPPNFRRRSPVYGEYEGNETGGRGGSGGGDRKGRNRGRRGSPRRRDRSPPGRFPNAKGTQASPEAANRELSLPKVPKNVTIDATIGPNNVRVLSRTLFVGGVTINDDDLRKLFENFGLVQSCIVNQDKRHAFIKMLTREDAVKAKSGMETYRTDNMTLRTRWGVGFGPRDCSDYQTGVSVIPIDRLTEADQRWMVSAEYGGTGGQPLKGGMCVEEPDIEIGQGVSSKAISKRFPTDSGGNKGPRSSGEHGAPPNRGSGGKRKEQDHTKTADAGQRAVQGGRDNVGVAPPTPGFGAGFPFTMPMTLPPGMPHFQYPGFPGAPTG